MYRKIKTELCGRKRNSCTNIEVDGTGVLTHHCKISPSKQCLFYGSFVWPVSSPIPGTIPLAEIICCFPPKSLKVSGTEKMPATWSAGCSSAGVQTGLVCCVPACATEVSQCLSLTQADQSSPYQQEPGAQTQSLIPFLCFRRRGLRKRYLL